MNRLVPAMCRAPWLGVLFAACLMPGSVPMGSQSTQTPADPKLPSRVPADPASDEPCTHARSYEILSDTQHVDFAPYMKDVLKSVRDLWVPRLPPEARPPTSLAGWSVLRFSIGRSGQLTAVHLDGSSHNSSLDQAAWAAVTKMGSFPSFPAAFQGPDLELRMAFCVNEKRNAQAF